MIHKFKMYNTNIVMDVYSGAVHVFDDVAFAVLDYFETNDKNQIVEKLSSLYEEGRVIEAIEEITELKNQELLYSEDKYTDFLPLWNKKPVIKALCLHICHDCNLRCKYCFASTGDFGGERSMMSPEVGKKAIDLLIKESSNRRNLEIDFFGGEPLMNFETVKEIVEYARSKEVEHKKNFRFTITTNAILLNEDNIKYINDNMQNVVLSIDGRKETNDRMRFRIDGSGTYNSILNKIKQVAKLRNEDNYYVRGTFTSHNLDFSEDVIHLADQGFKQISVEPVVASDGSGYELKEEHLPQLCGEYEKLVYEYVKRRKDGNWFNFFHFMLDLSQGPCVAKRIGGCGSGHEYLAITPDGEIYPCHQFVGMPEFKMGTVNSGIVDKDIQSTFKNSNIYTKNECKECWAKFYCSGGCAANSLQFNGSIDASYHVGCELERKRVECALWAKTQEI